MLSLLLIACLLVAAMLHECGHYLCARFVGVRVKKWRAVYMVRESGTPAQNLAISVCGPMTNFVLAGSIMLTPWLHLYAIAFCLANWCVGFFNVLPIRYSDGSRIAALLSDVASVRGL
jgi:Zn-dependent protease